MTTSRSELLGNGGSYEGIGEMYVVEQEVNYKNHPHFVAIDLLVKENELPRVGQNEDPIRVVGETADLPQQITQKRQQLREHSMSDSCIPRDGLQESPPLYNNPSSG